MSIIKKDGFDFYSDINGNIDAFILKDNDIDSEIDYIIKNKMKSIALNYFDSRSIADLSSIKGLDFIEKISLDDIDINLQDLYSLKNLKELYIY